jgi:hypothetical protein
MKRLALLVVFALSAFGAVRPQISSSTAIGDQVITHLADGGGWLTTIVLVNLSNAPASFDISFFDDTGAPYAFPFVENGNVSALTGQQIPAGGRWTINTVGSAGGYTTTGWADITNATGNIGGYAIFQYGNQMATVPIESWNGSRLILPFQDGNGIAMGVALVNPCTGPSDVTVTFRDNYGSLIFADSFPMTPGQHTSFVVRQRWPALAGRVGTALYETNGCLSGLGILANSAGAYTTVFSLDAQ